METYIALLRGINVSGQKKIKMADLKVHLSELGFQDIQTYIQSGNIIFRTSKTASKSLENNIYEKIKEKYDFEVPVLVKTTEEFASILKNIPFPTIKDYSKLYFTLLNKKPSLELVKKLKEVDYSPEAYFIDNKVIYVYVPNGYGRAKINNNFFEKKLKVSATTRNWKTTTKLLEMVNSTP